MNLNLRGKKALVCGSTQGIGKATAIQLASQGASIILFARNEDKLKQVLSELDTDQDQQHDYLVGDFNNSEALKKTLTDYINTNGTINILINNTGGPPAGPAIDADVSEYLNAFKLHLVSNQTLVQIVAPGMKTDGYGRIINVISTSVKQPLTGLGVSNTIRGAVANWAKTLSNELASFGITVNNVLPGATNTVRLKQIIENKAAKTGKSTDEVASVMASEVPMKRFAEAEEIANGISFLASPAASYINGINLPVDGGRTKSL
jgi:3-oxoacyl-[acyl-carrier protein] reductase